MRGIKKQLCLWMMVFGYMVSAFGQEVDWDFLLNQATQEINRNAKDPNAYTKRGFVYYQKGDFDKGIADFNQAIRLDPNNASFYFLRGAFHLAKEDLNRAIADYQKAVQLDPSNQQYKEYLQKTTEIANTLNKSPPSNSGSGSRGLQGTTWFCADGLGGAGGGEAGLLIQSTLDFGSNSFKRTTSTYLGGILIQNETMTGTYTMSGDTLTLIPDDGGDRITGRVIGNSFTLSGGAEYRRVQ